MSSGASILDMERKGMLAILDIETSTDTDLGVIVPVGRTVVVTAVSLKTSATVEFRLQDGGGSSPGDDKYVIGLNGASSVDKSFRHPLLFDGLAAEWSSGVPTVRANIAYKILD